MKAILISYRGASPRRTLLHALSRAAATARSDRTPRAAAARGIPDRKTRSLPLARVRMLKEILKYFTQPQGNALWREVHGALALTGEDAVPHVAIVHDTPHKFGRDFEVLR